MWKKNVEATNCDVLGEEEKFWVYDGGGCCHHNPSVLVTMSRSDTDAGHCQGGALGWRCQVWVPCPWIPMEMRLLLMVLHFWGIPTAQSLVETQEEQQSQLHSGMFSRHTQGAQGQEKGFYRAV